MKKFLTLVFAVLSVLSLASCSKSAPFTSYEISSIQSDNAYAIWNYNVTDISGVQYSYTLETTQAAAENVNNIKSFQAAYNNEHATYQLTGLQPSTTYYSVGFLKVGNTLYSSKTVKFTTYTDPYYPPEYRRQNIR